MPRRRTPVGAITPASAESSGISWPSGGKRIILIPPPAPPPPGHDAARPGYLPEDESVDNRWKNCGKPVDDSVEKPVDFRCRYPAQACEKPGFVRICFGAERCEQPLRSA